MTTFYGVKLNVYKNNRGMAEETVIQPYIYKTEEEAFNYCRKEADNQVLFNNHRLVAFSDVRGFAETCYIQHSSKTGKDTLYRYSYEVVKYELKEEQ